MKIGLILSGGFGKGGYQVGALKAIMNKIPFDSVKCISATSVGCLNGCGFAAGDVTYAEYAWNAINKDSKNVFLTDLFKNGFLDNVAVDLGNMTCLTDFYIAVLKMGHKIRVVDYINLREIADKDRRRDYLRASVAVPVVSKSVKIDGYRHYDGGCVDNNPIKPLLNKDLDVIIAICFDHLVSFTDDEEIKKKMINICFDDGVRIKKDMIFTKESVQKMISYGEEYAQAILDFVFDKNADDITEIQKRIDKLREIQGAKRNKKNITVAHTITAFNRFSQKLVTKNEEE